ncbi:MAG: glycerate 2-kinase [Alphaproteobacteria bacterium]|nr:glycerate 2-kinase [Alphaproteobacteria bacterium]
MTEIAEQHYLQSGFPKDRLLGLAVTRHGYARPTQHIPVIEAGHPVPDQTGIDATEQTLVLAEQAGIDDLLLVLLSGGASANWIAPAPGLALADKQATTRALLRSGASISEVNTVRKHLSRIKGGRLAARGRPARIVTLAISDVPGDNPDVIGSGPTVPDPSTLSAARGIVEHYGLEIPAGISLALSDPTNETPKPADAIFHTTEFSLVARPDDAFRAAREMARKAGFDCVFLGDQVEGEACEVAQEHGRIARELLAQNRRAVILSGGELTVTLHKQGGQGGPNQEYALALAIALEGTRGIAALAADTDGTDGGSGAATDPAGAFADGTTAARARALGLDPASFLANNNSTEFFAPLGDLLMSGPTFTNVNDFRAILVDTA